MIYLFFFSNFNFNHVILIPIICFIKQNKNAFLINIVKILIIKSSSIYKNSNLIILLIIRKRKYSINFINTFYRTNYVLILIKY